MRPEPGDERVSLVIAIEDVGPNGKVGPIEVSGLVRHTATELLEWLGVKRGQPITADLVPRLERQMAESGRFLAQKVIPKQIPDEAGQVLLRVEVTEYTDSPPLGAPFSAAEQQFLQMRSWVESAFQRGEEFSIEVEAADFPLESIGLRITGQLEFILQRDGMALLQRVGGSWSGEWCLRRAAPLMSRWSPGAGFPVCCLTISVSWRRSNLGRSRTRRPPILLSPCASCSALTIGANRVRARRGSISR